MRLSALGRVGAPGAGAGGQGFAGLFPGAGDGVGAAATDPARPYGVLVTQCPEDPHAMMATRVAFQTLMPQNVNAGRALELDALVAAVHETGQRVRRLTPNIAALLGLARLFARTRRLDPMAGVRLTPSRR